MAYSSPSGIYSSLPETDVAQLTDDVAGETVDEVRVDEAIAKADALIDAFMPSAIDDNAVPEVIAQISASLAIYYLYKRKMGTNMPESVESDYKRQIDLLKLIQSGKMSIGLTPSTSDLESGGAFHKTNKTTDDRIFGSATWEKY